MSHGNTGGRRGIAAAAFIAAVLSASACGTQTAVTDLDGAVPGNAPSASQEGRSSKSLDADARRWARGKVPEAPDAPAGGRVPDARP
jgi:hypothetical protein